MSDLPIQLFGAWGFSIIILLSGIAYLLKEYTKRTIDIQELQKQITNLQQDRLNDVKDSLVAQRDALDAVATAARTDGMAVTELRHSLDGLHGKLERIEKKLEL